MVTYVRTRNVLEVHEDISTVGRGKIVKSLGDVPSNGVICFIGSTWFLDIQLLSYDKKDYMMSIIEHDGKPSLYIKKKQTLTLPQKEK